MIELLFLSETYHNKSCEICGRNYKTAKPLKVLRVDGKGWRLCNTCLKEIHKLIHEKCELPLIHTSITL